MPWDVACTRRKVLLSLPLTWVGLAADTVDEDLLHDRVHRKLNNHRLLKIKNLRVDVSDGVVTIQGIVRSEKLKARASKVASIKGVKQVINRLEIGQ